MPKSKKSKPKNISLSYDQMETLIYSSVRNIADLQVECGNGDNEFLITLVLGCIIEEAFPNRDVKDIENEEDYDTEEFYISHIVEPLQPFSNGVFIVKNDETKEKLWGVQLYIDKHSVADFLEALFEINCFWMSTEEMDGDIKEPSKNSVVFEGNGTVN